MTRRKECQECLHDDKVMRASGGDNNADNTNKYKISYGKLIEWMAAIHRKIKQGLKNMQKLC